MVLVYVIVGHLISAVIYSAIPKSLPTISQSFVFCANQSIFYHPIARQETIGNIIEELRYSISVSIGSQAETDIPQNSSMIITLANGKEIECPTVIGGPSVLQSIDVQLSDVYQNFRRFAYYNIKAKDLKKIQKSSIVQIDIQLYPSDYSVSFNDNQLGNLLSANYGLIKETLE